MLVVCTRRPKFVLGRYLISTATHTATVERASKVTTDLQPKKNSKTVLGPGFGYSDRSIPNQPLCTHLPKNRTYHPML